MRTLRRIAMPFALIVAAACGGGGDPGTGPNPGGGGGGGGGGSTSNSIAVNDNSFAPANTTVAPGTTVTWTWAGSGTHNVSFTDGVASPNRSSGTFQRTFATAGVFNYSCTLHAGMSGRVTVQ